MNPTDIKTYRARSLHEALSLVRHELGPDAAVLHTREIQNRRLFGLLQGQSEIEVTASTSVNVPSRLPELAAESAPPAAPTSAYLSHAVETPAPTPAAVPPEYRSPIDDFQQETPPSDVFSDEIKGQLTDLQSMLQDLCQRRPGTQSTDLPDSLFHLFTDLIDADLSEDVARALVDRVRMEATGTELTDPMMIRTHIAGMVEADIPVSGPIQVTPGTCRVVALVGPTGVGKTTTIAKLAANFRLKEKHKVGLITVDTYRIAAVEQLRTYADIINLPMEVVSTPREMREAIDRMRDLDLILMDTAGRSPRDDIKIQELRSLLAEANVDEVHLVLSSVASTRTLTMTAERFAAVGTTNMILTKLDEATAMGNLLPLVSAAGLPLSYLTNGQNVPDDIEIARRDRLARLVLGMDHYNDPRL